MARTRKNVIRLFKRGLTHWGEFTLFDGEVARFNNIRPDWLKKAVEPDVRGRIQVSFRTFEERVQMARLAQLETAIGQVQGNATVGMKKAATITVADRFKEVYQKELADSKLYADPVQGRRQKFIRPRTVLERKRKREYFLEFLKGRYPTRTLSMHEVNVGIVAEFLDWLRHPCDFHKGLGDTTRGSVKDYLSGLWQEACDLEYCRENPWSHKKLQITEHVAADEGGRITMLHEAELFNKLPWIYGRESTWDNNGIIMMMLTGCRPSDLYEIQRSHVMTTDNLPFINNLMSKTARWKRLPLTPLLKPIVERQFASHDSLWLFPWRDKKTGQWRKCEEQDGTKRWYREVLRWELPGKVTPYTFRYTFETVGQKLGFSTLLINALMGHKNPKRTMAEIYTKFPTADIYAAAEKIQSFLVGAGQVTTAQAQ